MNLKTGIFILLAFLCLSVSAQRFHGGLLGGINASQIDGDSYGGYYKAGLNFGTFVNTTFNDKWGGQLEIKYAGKGSSSSPKSPDIYKIQLGYIDLPVMATYQALEKIQLQAGISFNYLFRAFYYDDDWVDYFQTDYELPPERFETSITFGLSYSVLENINVNMRYNYSIMPIRSRYSTSSWGRGAWYNNVVSFSVYYKLSVN